MKLNLKLGQRLVMTPMLQQAIKLLPLARLELAQLVRQEIIENPILEEIFDEEDSDENLPDEQNTDENETDPPLSEVGLEDIPGTIETKENDYDPDWEPSFQENIDQGMPLESYVEKPDIEATAKREPTLADHLHWQLNLSLDSDTDKFIGSLIIGNINNDGYFLSELTEIADISKSSEEKVQEILQVIQTFEPSGVGARSLKECLLIQAQALPEKYSLLEIIIKSYLEKLDERNYLKIASEQKVPVEEILAAVKALREFDPKPGQQFSSEEIDYVVPDLWVVKKEGEYDVTLNDEGVPKIKINAFYQNLLDKEADSQTKEYLGDKHRSALWLIKSIDQRRQTIYKVGKSIIKLQTEFLEKGQSYLKPMVLREVAADIEMHESTVSRITTNKYMDTPHGIFELKFFFHSGIKSFQGNGNISSIRVKNMIKEAVNSENKKKPYTDDDMVTILMQKDAKIARRTVTKYRKELNIPPASKRKRIY
ncbi:MAG: RNA polymerase factor sigma-54 [Nitrospinales bacterium]